MALERWRRLSAVPLQSVVREIHGKWSVEMYLVKIYYVAYCDCPPPPPHLVRPTARCPLLGYVIAVPVVVAVVVVACFTIFGLARIYHYLISMQPKTGDHQSHNSRPDHQIHHDDDTNDHHDYDDGESNAEQGFVVLRLSAIAQSSSA